MRKLKLEMQVSIDGFVSSSRSGQFVFAKNIAKAHKVVFTKTLCMDYG